MPRPEQLGGDEALVGEGRRRHAQVEHDRVGTFAPDENSHMSVWIVDGDGSDRRRVSAGTVDDSLPDPHPRRG